MTYTLFFSHLKGTEYSLDVQLIDCSLFALKTSIGVQEWRSGESTRLPPVWPRFDSQTRHHMCVEFVGSLLRTERFSPGTPVSPLLKNQHLN